MNKEGKKIFIGIGIVVIVILFITFYIWVADFTPKNKEDELLKKIEALELKLDSLNNRKDSIRTAIDSTHIKIITNEKHYQERVNTIITQPYSADSGFVTDYIRQYADKNPQYNFSRTPKTY